jgi:biopolymer transport protein ExbD
MAFQPSKSKKHKTNIDIALNLNSMMDMMTILLLFLIKSFSTSGALATQSTYLKLPVSDRQLKPKKELNIALATDMILVNEMPVMRVGEIKKESILLPALENKLAEYAKKEKQLEIETGRPFANEVVIQADKSITFDVLFKVLYTCSKTEFYKMRLMTVQGSKMKI